MSGIGRRLLSSLRDALSGISQLSQPGGSSLMVTSALAEQLVRARTALAEGRAQEVVDDLETSLDSLVLLFSATSATLGSAYDKLDRGRDRDRAFRQAVELFRMTTRLPAPAEIVAIVPWSRKESRARPSGLFETLPRRTRATFPSASCSPPNSKRPGIQPRRLRTPTWPAGWEREMRRSRSGTSGGQPSSTAVMPSSGPAWVRPCSGPATSSGP